MSKNRHRLYEGKIKASLLLKHLRSEDLDTAQQSARRFQILPQYSAFDIEHIILQSKTIQLKQALGVIALEHGVSDWSRFKRKITEEDCLYPQTWSAHFNTWYANYDEAKDHLGKVGGYLLRYRQHYFICENGYIQALGLGEYQAEW